MYVMVTFLHYESRVIGQKQATAPHMGETTC